MMFKYKDNNSSIVATIYLYKRALNKVFKLNNCYYIYFYREYYKNLLEEVLENYRGNISVYKHCYNKKCKKNIIKKEAFKSFFFI